MRATSLPLNQGVPSKLTCGPAKLGFWKVNVVDITGIYASVGGIPVHVFQIKKYFSAIIKQRIKEHL